MPPQNMNAPLMHGVRFAPHVGKQAYRQALVEQLQRDSINGRGGQSDRTEQHNATKKIGRVSEGNNSY